MAFTFLSYPPISLVYPELPLGPECGLESNHRFSTDNNVIDGMVSHGWIAEGIVFCVDASP